MKKKESFEQNFDFVKCAFSESALYFPLTNLLVIATYDIEYTFTPYQFKQLVCDTESGVILGECLNFVYPKTFDIKSGDKVCINIADIISVSMRVLKQDLF